MSTYADRQLLLAIHRKQNEKGVAAASSDYSQCGPPNWDRSQWDAYKAQYGSYPFGPDQNGAFISPPHWDDAPPWVYELIGQREPPVRTRRPT